MTSTRIPDRLRPASRNRNRNSVAWLAGAAALAGALFAAASMFPSLRRYLRIRSM
jgi:hypothetical protein